MAPKKKAPAPTPQKAPVPAPLKAPEPTPPEPEPEPEQEPEPEPPVLMLLRESDWEQIVDEVGDGMLAVVLYAPARCAASRRASAAFDQVRADPRFAFATFAAIDIDAAEEYFVTNVLTGPTSPDPHNVPVLQFLKNGFLLTQFVGGDELRLRAELSRLGAALRISG